MRHPVHVRQHLLLPATKEGQPHGYLVQRGRLFYWVHQGGKYGQVWRAFRSDHKRTVGKPLRQRTPLFASLRAACQTHRVRFGRMAVSESGGGLERVKNK